MVSSNEKQAFSARLNDALDRAGIAPKGKGRQVELARMFRVSQKGARKWVEGESIPKTARLMSIARRLRVSTEWLLTGHGHDGVEEPPCASYHATPLQPQNPAHQHLMELFDALTESQQEMLLYDMERKVEENEKLLNELMNRKPP